MSCEHGTLSGTCGIKAFRYGRTFDLHPSEKRGALHHLQITQHTRSPHPSVHLRLAIPVPRPLLSGLQSGVTKRPRENSLPRSTDLRLLSRVYLQDCSQSEISLVLRARPCCSSRWQRHAITPLALPTRIRTPRTYICTSRASLCAPIRRTCLVAGCIFTRPNLSLLLPATSNGPPRCPAGCPTELRRPRNPPLS